MLAFIVTCLIGGLIAISRHGPKPKTTFSYNKNKKSTTTERNNFTKTFDTETKGSVIEIQSKSHYNSMLLNKKDIIVLDFYSDKCAPCKVLSPYIDKFANQFQNDDFIFGKVNCDSLSEITMENSVTGMPTVIFYKKGHEINRVVGCDILKIKKFLESNAK